ncbi:hypothetical protein [Vibrio penaeicida]|uniref:Uncharacterized protein n=1 Tax=Vibrio penaeicida TaxID=104609 RepID=A0AAV5NKI7_9VIBR|nr:hypothetical protein [Vibrio penaeicida]RTZ24615.1 hypothetical protein EKN09_02855 [Vibrio penaeicida]GLQ71115.1 hypothetical protein GCM10007932_04750 [Vibrio penaeicida]
MDQFTKERIEKEDAIKAAFKIGLIVVTKGFNGHHRIVDNLIGVVTRVERNDYVRQMGVSICFSNNYYEEFYEEELANNFLISENVINSVATHDLSTDSKIDEYIHSPSFTHVMETAHDLLVNS